MAEMYERINNRRYEDDIACALAELLPQGMTSEEKEDLTNGLYWLKCAADNNCNHDYFRTLYNVLSDIAADRGY